MSEPTLDVAALLKALQAIGAQPTKTRSKSKGRKGKRGNGRAKLTDAEKAVYMAKNDAECIAAFELAGFKDIKPRVNVLTYKKFIAIGRMVRKGEKSTQVGPFSLFHVEQTDALPDGAMTAQTVTANQVAA